MVIPRGKLVGHAVNAMLALSSVAATLVVLELGLRVEAHLENRGILSETTELGIEPPPDAAAQLGHLIRLSPRHDIIYELKPGLDVTYAGARVQTDESGLRSASSPAEVAAAGYRIVGIGDSFMFGQGVAGEATYLALVEERLRRERPDLDVRILNTAVPGYNTVMEVETLKEKGLALSPDLVILEFVANDLELPNFIRSRQDVLALDRSFLNDFVTRRFRRGKPTTVSQRLQDRGVEPALVLDDDEVPAEYRHMVGFDAYTRALEELRELGRRYGFEVLSITLSQPARYQKKVMLQNYAMGFHFLHVGEHFRRHLDREGIAEYLGSPLSQAADDGHPSALGHRLAADVISRFLLDEVLPVRSPAARARQLASHDPSA